MSPRGRLLLTTWLSAWAPPAAWCLLIFVLSSLSLRTGADLPRGSDKAAHLVEYGVLGFLAARALSLTAGGLPRAAVVILGALLAVLYGATDEFHQLFVPERSAEWGDLLADGVGGVVGAALLAAVRRRPSREPVSAPGSGAAPPPPLPGPGRPRAR